MNNPKDSTRVLVGVDGSDASIDALRRAARIAAGLHAPLEAITTWEFPVMVGGYYQIDNWSPEIDAQQILSSAIDQAFGDAPPAKLTRQLSKGRPLASSSTRPSMLPFSFWAVAATADLPDCCSAP